MKQGFCGISSIALICTTAVAESSSSTAQPPQFVLTKDAEKWQKIGIDNANRDLDKFEAIASAIATGSTDHTELETHLHLLQSQTTEISTNNRKLIQQILQVINQINGFLESDSPSTLSKIGLKTLIWYLDGTRDNKSYYLLDGCQLWCEFRIKILQNYAKEKVQGYASITALIGELEKLKINTIELRDELDHFAQIFVAKIKQMHLLTGDIGMNLVELKMIGVELKTLSDQSGIFLENKKNLEIVVQDLVGKYGS